MKKIYIWHAIWAIIMLALYFFYLNGLTTEILFCKKVGWLLLIKNLILQFIHFNLFHYLCNMFFMGVLLNKLKDNYNFVELVITEIVSMWVVAIALLLFSNSEKIYAGSSGIILGVYALWWMENYFHQDNLKKKEMIIEGVFLVVITIFTPGVSVLMHFAGIIGGILCFLILKNKYFRHN